MELMMDHAYVIKTNSNIPEQVTCQVACDYSPHTWEAEEERSLEPKVGDQPGQHSEILTQKQKQKQNP